ncbi:MAG: EAL domain-containing protein [Geminicoccaceae bacterium]|nr:MAG: EAL domain-containing protein [Geminicoccaceae bacterium]
MADGSRSARAGWLADLTVRQTLWTTTLVVTVVLGLIVAVAVATLTAVARHGDQLQLQQERLRTVQLVGHELAPAGAWVPWPTVDDRRDANAATLRAPLEDALERAERALGHLRRIDDAGLTLNEGYAYRDALLRWLEASAQARASPDLEMAGTAEAFAAFRGALDRYERQLAAIIDTLKRSRAERAQIALWLTILMAVSSLVAVIGAGWVYEYRIARPLAQLVATTRGQADDPAPPLAVTQVRCNELEHLRNAFDALQGRVERLHRQAYLDPLTGLANRSAFLQRLAQALDAERRHRRRFAVLLLDLDHFKQVNDSLGHAVGDQLLIEMAARLQRGMRPSDTLARLGGDEFAIVQADLPSDLPPERMAERIVEAAGLAFDLDGHAVFVGASVGIALCPDDGIDADTLLRHADLALYEAKAQGRDGWRFFTPAMNDAVVERRALELDLRHALETNGIQFLFQPKFALRSGRLVGVETLARWQHPERGPIPTDRLIALAEGTGLIEPLGAKALAAALRAAARWRPLTAADFTVGVNLSVRQLRRGRFADDVAAALERADVAPGHLVLEIDESVLAEDDPTVLTALHDVTSLGVRLALDDFGTGYASLRHLHRLPFDELKVDRSFVREVTSSADAAAIVRAIVAVGRALDLTVTAEGIETEAQRELVMQAGATFGQGFLLSPPIDADGVARLLTAAVPTVDIQRLIAPR